MGRIVAIGGGENGRPGYEYETGAFDREIVALTNKKRPIFLFVGLASNDSEGYFDVMKNIYNNMYGCETEHLTEDDIKTEQTALRKIEKADIIYVGGGNTLRLMTLLRKFRIDEMLKNAYASNKVLCGVSAGAICWCNFGNSDSRKFSSGSNQLIKVRGLGLIHVLMCPHFNIEINRQEDLARMMRSTNKIPAIALDNGAALEINNDKYRVLISIEGAKAQKCYWKNGEYLLQVLQPNVYHDIESLYTKN